MDKVKRKKGTAAGFCSGAILLEKHQCRNTIFGLLAVDRLIVGIAALLAVDSLRSTFFREGHGLYAKRGRRTARRTQTFLRFGTLLVVRCCGDCKFVNIKHILGLQIRIEVEVHGGF